MKKPATVESASSFIDEKIKELGDWRGKTLAKVRDIIHAADPEIVEERKWVKPNSPGTPVFSHERHRVHRRDVQERRQVNLCQGSCVEGPFRSVQLQPRGECQACYRYPRRREDQ